MKWPFGNRNKPKHSSKKELIKAAISNAQDIVADFGDLIAEAKAGAAIQDVSKLPYSREKIFSCICLLWRISDDEMKERLRGVTYCLSYFQNGVGPQNIHILGIDPSRLDASSLNEEEFVDLVLSSPQGKDRYDRIKPLVDADWSRMSATLDAIR